jgi:hypothetical protein
MAYTYPSSRSADMAAQLAAKGLTFNGAQVVPIQQDVAPTYEQPDYTSSYAAPPARQLGTAPEWLAYLSALGLEESMARADVDRMRGLYQSEAQRLKQDLVPQ